MDERKKQGPSPQKQGPASKRPNDTQVLSFEVVKLTDVGRTRPHNEDYVDFYVPPDPRQLARRGALYLVADGMGGHQAGEVASQGAVEVVIGQYYSDTTHDVGTSLVRAFRVANQAIYDQAQADPSKAGMGTTLVAAVILGRKVYVANVGDSRAYLINQQGIAQITEDHSWVDEQVRAGLLTPEQARRHPQRNLVTRALGTKPSVEVDLFEGEVGPGDALLLCTDGLTGRVEDRELAAVVREHPPQEAARLLVAQANERGGNDNITVLIVSAQKPVAASIEDEKATVPAPALAPKKKKQELPPFLIPALVGVAAVMMLVLGGLVIMPLLSRRTPTATPTATAPAVVTMPTVIPAMQPSPTVEVVLIPTGSLTPVQEETPAGPTATLAPTLTPRSTNTPTLPPPTQRPQATPQPQFSHPAPTLVEPTPEAELQGQVTFKWNYGLGQLGLGNAFQVLIWPEGAADNEHNGAAVFVRALGQTINLDDVLPARGGPGRYFWSVVVVHKRTEKRISPEASPWPFTYKGPQSSPQGPPEPPPAVPSPEPPTESPPTNPPPPNP